MTEPCAHEQDWGRLWEIMKTYSRHTEDGDKPGGYRDRLLRVEMDNADLKKQIASIDRGRWIIGIVGGIVGALIGSGCRDGVNLLIKWMIGG
jgi:hypothetical protein